MASYEWPPIGPGSGTVSSVGLADGSTVPIYVISGSPVTTTGTLTFTLHTQAANLVLAGPATGAAAQPGFRALVTADMPAGTGTVTSVAMTVPTFLAVAGSPITTSGTLALTFLGVKGDLILGTGVNTSSNLGIGSTGNVLTVSGGTAVWAPPATSGTVTTVSVVSANGFAGTVATATSTPAITLSTTISGILYGNGTAISSLVSIAAKGDLVVGSAANAAVIVGIGSTGNVLTVSGGTAVWAPPATSGTVTSVALSVPATSIFGVSGSPVTSSGTLGLTTSGTSGGIPYFSSTTQLASSALLAQYGVVLGGGAGAAPVTLTPNASTTFVLTSGGVSANPSWAAVTASSFGTQTAGTFLAGPTSGSAATPTFRALQIPTFQSFTAAPTGATNYTFTISSHAFIKGDTYTNNGQTFTVLSASATSTILIMSGTGTPAASGTLTWASGSGSGNITFSAFTGAYVPSAGVLWAEVLVVGGGGGGGASGANTGGEGGGGGGGGGGASILYLGSLAALYIVTVGASGSGGVQGGAAAGNGGTSSFASSAGSTLAQATGGSGGSASSGVSQVSSGGSAGVGSIGTFNVKGTGGGAGVFGIAATVAGCPGAGGASAIGTAGGAGKNQSDTAEAGGAYGGGGGGGCQVSGAAGGGGVVFIKEYYQ